MAQKEYKELRCRDAGVECHFLIRAETVEEAIRLASEHSCLAHDRCEITFEMRDSLKAAVRRVWCERECTYIPRTEWRFVPGEWMED